MKSIVIQPTVQLDNEERQESMVLEASVNGNGQKRNFTAADMWNRNRKVRSAGSMVRRWHLS
jgi:hypothetical protein